MRRSALLIFLAGLLLFTACQPAPTSTPAPAASAVSTAAPEPTAPTQPPPPTSADLPAITGAILDRPELHRYESLELTVGIDARYSNPYDQREVRLEAVFTSPDGSQMRVPGFWDGEAAWKVRFTPSQTGQWTYQLAVADSRGASGGGASTGGVRPAGDGMPSKGEFQVTGSDLHGWLQPGDRVDPSYSGRYLVYHDGTPFYGLGHCDYKLLSDGFSFEAGVGLFDKMVAAGENFVVWWPFYANSPVSGSYDQYTLSNLKLIDRVVADAQQKGVFIIFTVWDHPQLRGDNHPWGRGNYRSSNGFKKLVEVEDFFTDAEAWAWQENLYRYIIARWGYSPAIGMWQTVSEINGTNAGANLDAWHSRLNAYFVENDPYRHPTTASMSGDVDWPAGHAEMDAPQVHVYELDDPLAAAETLAMWTGRMFERYNKPNWTGEFGVPGNLVYPEMFHHSIWAALAAGAAMTPAEWNDRGSWMHMTDEMLADLARLGRFVTGMPLAQWDPTALEITTAAERVRGWGMAGEQGGLLWVQDYRLEGRTIQEIRTGQELRSGVELEVAGLAAGTYRVTPYDTWQGEFLDPLEVTCQAGAVCRIPLPDFTSDIAFRIERQ